MVNKDNTYFVPVEKEIIDTGFLVEQIKESKWIDKNVIIVNCYPDYSSIPSQLINHKLSYLNNNELFESVWMELPYKSMNQVWNRETFKFQIFDKYLMEWIAINVNENHKYLFVSSLITDGQSFRKLNSVMKNKSLDYKFATLYLHNGIGFDPNFVINKITTKKRILFSWENSETNNF